MTVYKPTTVQRIEHRVQDVRLALGSYTITDAIKQLHKDPSKKMAWDELNRIVGYTNNMMDELNSLIDNAMAKDEPEESF